MDEDMPPELWRKQEWLCLCTPTVEKAGMDVVEDVVKRKGRGDRAQVMRRGAVGGGYNVPAPNGGADPNGGNP